ncbi:MAG: hypothetical protein OXH14_12180, partial [Alphaproteobacteria bacterium]|nr:hypothetical protein [Alphaproteobacteria bacterium]
PLEAGPPPERAAVSLPAPVLPPEGALLDEVRMLAAAAGLPDDGYVLALIAEGAPHARAMGKRLDRDYGYSDEI